ncbi:MAG: tripartite tricarboxylate transporter substrate binding protein [Deltaproteobacteria bacterium]
MRIKMFQRKATNKRRNPFGPPAGIAVVFLLLISIATLVLPVNSGARDWPTKTITLIVPWAAGGATDLAARVLAPQMSKILEVPVQVVGKPGGSGIIGTLEAVKAPPDGYTLLMDCNGTSSIQFAWSENLPYKPEERTYIARAISTLESLLVPASSPVKTVEDLVTAIRTNPASVSFGNIGGTGAPDATLAQFRAALMAKGLDLSKTRMVTYKGSGETITAVAGGHVSACMSGIAGTQALISAGKIRVLAVTSAQRYKPWPTVPTMAELGYPTVNMLFWASLGGPPGLPANIVKILEQTVKEALMDPDVIAKLDKIGIEPAYQPGDVYKKFVFDEWQTIKSLKLK